MERMKATVASLLPTLWLVTAGQCFLDPVGHCTTGDSWAWTTASESGKDCSSKHACLFLEATRTIHSRIGTQSGPDKIPLLETSSDIRRFELARLVISSPGSEV